MIDKFFVPKDDETIVIPRRVYVTGVRNGSVYFVDDANVQWSSGVSFFLDLYREFTEDDAR